ncbi:hypothetical protein PV350_37340 [Streptomyces sp. PA03-6a]|nr:hypothetical protein [Streptomyces sp. PA03-6a]
MGFDVDKDLYFVRKETEGIKKALTGISLTTTGISHSMTGIKGDVEGLKAAVAVVAATAQLFKVDYSFVKIDEKGLSVRGVQKITFGNVKAAEQAKDEKKQRELDDRLRRMFLAKSEHQAISSAQAAADRANRDVRDLRTRLRGIGQGADLGARGAKREEFNKLRSSVQGLSQALAGI